MAAKQRRRISNSKEKLVNSSDVFDFSRGEIRTATVKGNEIKYRVPDGTTIAGLHLSAATMQADCAGLAKRYASFVADHLVEWPWSDVAIGEKSIDAMIKKQMELFWAIEETIESAGSDVKN